MASSPKTKTVFACQACGFETSKWLGRCPDCGEWNSFVEERQETAWGLDLAAETGPELVQEVMEVLEAGHFGQTPV